MPTPILSNSGKSTRYYNFYPGFIQLLFITIALTCNQAQADTVLFKSGRILTEVKAKEVDKEGRLRIVMGANAALLVLEEDIEKIDYDYDSLKEKLAEDDLPGHYDLARWCEDHKDENLDFIDNAIELYKKAQGADGVPPDLYYRLAKLLTLKGSTPQELIDLYKLYLQNDPNGEFAAEAKTILAELNKINAPKEETEKTEDNKYPPVKNGRETANWVHASQYSAAAKVRANVPDAANPNNKVLEINCLADTNKNRDKVAVELGFSGSDSNWSKNKVIRFDACNLSASDIDISMAIVCGAGYKWIESPFTRLRKGEWKEKAEYKLDATTWKTEATGWSHIYTPTPEELSQVRKLVILVMNRSAAAKVYFDNIEIITE